MAGWHRRREIAVPTDHLAGAVVKMAPASVLCNNRYMQINELHYTVLIFALFVVPRLFMKFRLPAAITALFLGAFSGIGLDLFVQDQAVNIMSTLGVVALFLFAGLEVDVREILSNKRIIAVHVAIGLAALVVLTIGITFALNLTIRPAVVLALAIMTPSCGFILDSIDSFGLSDQEKFWIKSKAIATELVALTAMFLSLQTETAGNFAVSTGVLAAMVAILPWLFRTFAAKIAPIAPNSEFAFLLMTAFLCAIITRKLGAYYLVGAFMVGIAAHRFQELLPTITSTTMLHSVKVFASFFIPFYFFHAGLGISASDLNFKSIVVGLCFIAAVIPIRVFSTLIHRRVSLGESFSHGFPIAVSLLPNLVFGLALASILRDRFQVERHIFGGLIIYTVLVTMLPGLLLGKRSGTEKINSLESGTVPSTLPPL